MLKAMLEMIHTRRATVSHLRPGRALESRGSACRGGVVLNPSLGPESSLRPVSQDLSLSLAQPLAKIVGAICFKVRGHPRKSAPGRSQQGK